MKQNELWTRSYRLESQWEESTSELRGIEVAGRGIKDVEEAAGARAHHEIMSGVSPAPAEFCLLGRILPHHLADIW